MTEPSVRQRIVCSRCGSDRLRRSRARGPAEWLARTVEGARFYVCKQCGARERHTGQGPSPTDGAASSGRPVERRDIRAKRTQARRVATSIVVAGMLGAIFGLYVWSCEAKKAEAPPPDVRAQ